MDCSFLRPRRLFRLLRTRALPYCSFGRRAGAARWQRQRRNLQKDVPRKRRGQLTLALADPLPGLKAHSQAGWTQSWVLSGSSDCSSDAGDVSFRHSDPWCLRFAWEFTSEEEGLGLRVLCARQSESAESALAVVGGLASQERFGVNVPEILQEFWDVTAHDTQMAAAVFSAIANVLLLELRNTREDVCSTKVVARNAGSMDEDLQDCDTSLLRAQLELVGGELRARHLLLATRERTISIQAALAADNGEEEDSDDELDRRRVAGLDGAPLQAFLQSRHEVRLLCAVLRVAVDGAVHLCEANTTLMMHLRWFSSNEEEICTLKRSILPWLCSMSVPDDVLDGLVWGFTFGWPDSPSRKASNMFAEFGLRNR